MFNRFRLTLNLPSDLQLTSASASSNADLQPKFAYNRPHFLHLNDEEVQMSVDHKLRPIIHPKKPLAHDAGYSECVNAGKSKLNEDQAVVYQHSLIKSEQYVIAYNYYGLFDGHAGVGAAVSAANQLHHIVNEKLVDALDDIWLDYVDQTLSPTEMPGIQASRDIFIVGALEAAFNEMDELIAEDRTKYQMPGGCTALVALFILDRLYVANAGDSRAVICSGDKHCPMSSDFTPENEDDRIRRLAELQPALLGGEFTCRTYSKLPKAADFGKRVLYRDPRMKGWAYKTIAAEDMKIPVITGSGKRSRVMGTIGVTRGFGDHDLVSVYRKVPIKPLLSCHPEVRIYPLDKAKEDEVLVMGTDGLWDVITGEKAAEIVATSMQTFGEKQRCVSAATCLVGSARGIGMNTFQWRMKGDRPASLDDISAFVIPLRRIHIEHEKFKQKIFANPNNVFETKEVKEQKERKQPKTLRK